MDDEARRLRRNAYMREWRLKNREKAAASTARWNERNATHVKERERARYCANREKYLARAHERYQANRSPKKRRAGLDLERRRARNREHHYRHRDKRLAQKRVWNQVAGKAAQYSAKRDALVRSACPFWADMDVIDAAYEIARRRSVATGILWEVDHIVPIAGKLVCGLHVPANLRVIPKNVNRAKGNRAWPDDNRAQISFFGD